jgi:tetratricopeptide (TPR) repeat protein
MFRRLLEWLASGRDPRFRASREARLLLEDYLVRLGVGQEFLTSGQREQARRNPSLIQAERLYQQAVAMSEQEKAVGDVAVGNFQLGRLYHLQGRWDESAAALRRALDIYKDLLRPGREERQAGGDCHYWLGVVALAQGHSDEARQEFGESLKVDTDLGNREGQAAIRRAIASCDVPPESGASGGPRGG